MEFTFVELEEKHFREVFSMDLFTLHKHYEEGSDKTRTTRVPYKKSNFIGSTGVVALDKSLKVSGSLTIIGNLNTICIWINEEYRRQGILLQLLKEFENCAEKGRIYDFTPNADYLEVIALKELKYAYRENNKILYRK